MITTTRLLLELIAIVVAFNIGREYEAWQIDRLLNGFITFAVSEEQEDVLNEEQDDAD